MSMILLNDRGRYRIYKMDKYVTINSFNEYIDKTPYVMVSDAIDYDERLVFPVYLLEGFTEDDIINGTDKCIQASRIHVAGEHRLFHTVPVVKADTDYYDDIK